MSRIGVDPNREILASRGRPYGARYDRSQVTKAERSQARPVGLVALLGWFKEAWDADYPRRMHEAGVEPDSQLGAPALSGQMRARMAALDNSRAATATDYDRQKDTWAIGEAPRLPMLDALTRLRDGSERRKGYPITARILTRIAYVGATRLNAFALVCPHGEPEEFAELYLTEALNTLWTIWSRAQKDAGRQVA